MSKDDHHLRNGMSKECIEQSFEERRTFSLAKDEYTATPHDNFMTLALTIRDRMIERWIETQQRYHKKNVKRVYYLSMEFLIGRLLMHGIQNLGIEAEARAALKSYGINLDMVLEMEPDAGLGNGGLGRLAACFMDSMATLGIPAVGYGIMYDFGIFQQKIVNGFQVEAPDHWRKLGTPWAIERPEYQIRVRFGGRTQHLREPSGRIAVRWLDTDDIMAMPLDIPVPGFRNDVVNTLRLWSAKGTEEFGLEYFNHGDYIKAYENKLASENISKVLYPNDKVTAGAELRLKQEYFFVAASLADIIRRFRVHNERWEELPDRVAIQLNDTHPALATAELMRILLDEAGLEWDPAWEITRRTFGYTNHTLMPEALETWSVPLLGRVLPRHLEIIYEINARFLAEVSRRFLGDNDRIRRMSLVDESGPKFVRMAYLAVVASHSINGVSELHSELLKKTLFKDFFEMYPERFNNKTNGVTPRRWLFDSNPKLAKLITEAVGDGWQADAERLEGLLPKREDHGFREAWARVKRQNKESLSAFVKRTTGVSVPPDSIFDIQIKRIHEYKRQLLFAFFLIHHYLRLKRDPAGPHAPRTAIFGGKAAPGYEMAKLIIKFINNVASVVNADPAVRDKLSDLSEQISTAGTEASGTGCMKFIMNGALTIGTLDGANIEIAREVGADNMFIFGLRAEEVAKLKASGYKPEDWIRRSPHLAEIMRLVKNDFFSRMEPGIFQPITESLTRWDPFLVLADFEDYVRAQDAAESLYQDPAAWTKASIANVAKSGWFSSDRTIRDYAEEIWGIPVDKGRQIR
ncbi:MAG: glycogen/starch/alpha-glucan phosphorylase [Elusimicrobiota bacterium]|jgi:starch phosphorylase